MKRIYAFLLSGALLMSLGLYSCDTDNTTGVDTVTTENEVDGRLNDEEGGDITNENISPLDTAEDTAGDTSSIEANL